jgi:uncharacterized protein (TIGR02145 family)
MILKTKKIHPQIFFFIFGVLAVCFISCKKDDDAPPVIVMDVDGNSYKYVVIGSQTWMGENLRVTRYRNGDLIQYVTDPAAWASLSSGAWCVNNNAMANDAIYGKLYNWFAVSSGLLCPEGWKVPSDADWLELEDFLEGPALAGGKLKEPGTAHWSTPNEGATDEFDFSALPGGRRNADGSFMLPGERGHWWTRSSAGAETAYIRYIGYNLASISKVNAPKRYGSSVRCIRE